MRSWRGVDVELLLDPLKLFKSSSIALRACLQRIKISVLSSTSISVWNRIECKIPSASYLSSIFANEGYKRCKRIANSFVARQSFTNLFGKPVASRMNCAAVVATWKAKATKPTVAEEIEIGSTIASEETE